MGQRLGRCARSDVVLITGVKRANTTTSRLQTQVPADEASEQVDATAEAVAAVAAEEAEEAEAAAVAAEAAAEAATAAAATAATAAAAGRLKKSGQQAASGAYKLQPK